MTNKITKWSIQQELVKLIKKAERNGIKIAVASDPEGNGFNNLESGHAIYGDTKPDVIVLAVWGGEDEDDLFLKQV
jgi:hypothetical protein